GGLESAWFPTANSIWWSPLALLVLPIVLLWLLPAGIGFFLTHPDPGEDASQEPHVFCTAATTTLVLAVVGLVGSYYGLTSASLGSIRPTLEWIFAASAASSIALLGFVYHALTSFKLSITAQRVTLTRCVATGLKWLAAVLLVALIDTVGQTLYLML